MVKIARLDEADLAGLRLRWERYVLGIVHTAWGEKNGARRQKGKRGGGPNFAIYLPAPRRLHAELTRERRGPSSLHAHPPRHPSPFRSGLHGPCRRETGRASASSNRNHGTSPRVASRARAILRVRTRGRAARRTTTFTTDSGSHACTRSVNHGCPRTDSAHSARATGARARFHADSAHGAASRHTTDARNQARGRAAGRNRRRFLCPRGGAFRAFRLRRDQSRV